MGRDTPGEESKTLLSAAQPVSTTSTLVWGADSSLQGRSSQEVVAGVRTPARGQLATARGAAAQAPEHRRERVLLQPLLDVLIAAARKFGKVTDRRGHAAVRLGRHGGGGILSQRECDVERL